MPEQDIPTSYNVPDTDASREFLNAFLGEGWDTFGVGMHGGAENSAAELALQIFSSLNIVALTGVALLFIWQVAIGAIGTAKDGEPLGKKFSAAWLPLRLVVSIGGLAPIFKGLSFFQVVILALIGWSINLANYTWDIGNDFFYENAGQVTVNAPMQPTDNFIEVANGVLKALVLQEVYVSRRHQNIENRPGQWSYSAESGSSAGTLAYQFSGNLGILTIECSSEGDNMCQARKQAVNRTIEALAPVAADIANVELAAEDIDQLALYNATVDIQNILISGLTAKMSEGEGHLATELDKYRTTASERGWLMAGASYWSISWINQETRAEMFSNFKFDNQVGALQRLADFFQTSDAEAALERYRNYAQTAHGVKRGLPANEAAPSIDDPSKIIEFIEYYIKDTFGGVLSWCVESLTNRDPIAALSDLGDYFLNACWSIITIVVGALILGVATESISAGGIGVKGLVEATGTIGSFFLFAVVVPLVIYAFMLAFFLPALPFIIWMSAIAGWIILIVESLIAAPLWVAVHALPEGDGFAGQHARRGYMLLLGIVLRPPLMVAGFFLAVVLLNVVGQTLGNTFMFFVYGLGETKLIGPTGTIAMVILLGFVILIFAKKLFMLISYLPEHVTNWIGQQFQPLGEREDLQGTLAVGKTAGGAIGGGVGGFRGAGGKLRGIGRNYLKARRDKKELLKQNSENSINPSKEESKHI